MSYTDAPIASVAAACRADPLIGMRGVHADVGQRDM